MQLRLRKSAETLNSFGVRQQRQQEGVTPPPFDPFARQNAGGRGAPESTEFPPCFPLRFFFASVSFDGVRMFPSFHIPAPNPNCARFEARGKNARAARAKKMQSKRMYFTSKCTAFRFFSVSLRCVHNDERACEKVRARFRTRRAFPISGAVVLRGRLRFDGVFARRAHFSARAFFFVRRRSVWLWRRAPQRAPATRPRGSLELACGRVAGGGEARRSLVRVCRVCVCVCVCVCVWGGVG